MVLSSISPLFILWAIKGNAVIPECLFLIFCALMVAVPNAVLAARVWIAIRRDDRRNLTVSGYDDHRAHVIAYLFSLLLPFYRQELESWRDLTSMIVALAFIVFLFWHLHLHYINLIFAIFNFRVFTIHPPGDENPYTGRESLVLITRRSHIPEGEQLTALRLTNTLYLEN